MKNRHRHYLEFISSIIITIVSGNSVYAEDLQLKDVCSNRNSTCDAILYTSKIIAPTYNTKKDDNKVIEELRDLGWSSGSGIDVRNSVDSEGKSIDVDAQAIIAKRIVNGKTYYLVSFRGTEGVRDGLTDTVGGITSQKLPNGSEVHKGFYDYTDAVYKSPKFRAMVNEIIAAQSSGKQYEVLLTGHSLGGAAAQIMSYFLVGDKTLPSEKIKTVVFGSPAPGNQIFADTYLENVIRAEIDIDGVPYARNPIYTSVDYGTKVRLPANGETKAKLKSLLDQIANTPLWQIQKLKELTQEIAGLLKAAHGQYGDRIDLIYDEFRIAAIQQRNPLLDMNSISSCYTSQGSSHITSANCYISRAPDENLYFDKIRDSLPEAPEQKSQYTDGTIVRAPIDIGLTWNQSTNLDLDSHTVTPNGDHVYFDARGSLTQSPNTFLYRDSIPAIGRLGAEQTRITAFQDGTYRFYIYNFSDQQNLAPSGLSNSAAKVEIFQDGKPLTDIPNDPNVFDANDPKVQQVGQPYPGQNTFNVPTGQSGNTWYVFKLNTRTGILNRVDRFGNVDSSVNVPKFR